MFKKLLNSLSLKRFDSKESEIFEGGNLFIPTGATYGGLMLAQSIMAAGLTTSEYRLPNSMHAYYILPGDLSRSTFYEVQRLRDGAAYSHREVTAFQTDSSKPIFKNLISFHEGEDTGVEFQTLKMPEAGDPEKLKSMEEIWTPIAEKAKEKNPWANYYSENLPFEQKPFSKSLFFGADPEADLSGKNKLFDSCWVRIKPEDVSFYSEYTKLFDKEKDKKGAVKIQLLNRALLAFASDQFGFAPAMRQGGLSWLVPNSQYASLDHAMWFYDDNIDLAKWHLFTGISPQSGHGRGLGSSAIFNQEGKLVATYIQEGLLRADV
ncbi:MAG: thioesterase family protein [Candidatus Ancillula sp.]|nr:thioesterase family protein [Candidatus Ancillula sp.]